MPRRARGPRCRRAIALHVRLARRCRRTCWPPLSVGSALFGLRRSKRVPLCLPLQWSLTPSSLSLSYLHACMLLTPPPGITHSRAATARTVAVHSVQQQQHEQLPVVWEEEGEEGGGEGEEGGGGGGAVQQQPEEPRQELRGGQEGQEEVGSSCASLEGSVEGDIRAIRPTGEDGGRGEAGVRGRNEREGVEVKASIEASREGRGETAQAGEEGATDSSKEEGKEEEERPGGNF